MENNPLISVIVPAYNAEKNLAGCLDSIIAQTYPNIEIILIDDGSTDGTGEIMRFYEADNFQIRVITQIHQGVTKARAAGMRAVSGQWIGFIDSDDIIEPEMYSRLMENAVKYNAQISHSGMQMIFEDGRIQKFYDTGELHLMDTEQGLRKLLLGEFEPSLCNKLFCRELVMDLLESGEINSEITVNEDVLMNYQLFKRSESTVYDDWCPYRYMVHDDYPPDENITENIIYDPIKVRAAIKEDAEKSVQKYAEYAYINTCISTYNTLLFYGKKYEKDMENIRRMIAQEKNGFRILKKKRRVMATLIITVPWLYGRIAHIYNGIGIKNKYT